MKPVTSFLLTMTVLAVTLPFSGCNAPAGAGGDGGGGNADGVDDAALSDGIWRLESSDSSEPDCLWIESSVATRYFPACGNVDTLTANARVRQLEDGTVTVQLVVQSLTVPDETVTIELSMQEDANGQLTGTAVASSPTTNPEVVQTVELARVGSIGEPTISPDDPLPEFQLDQGNDQLDADVGAITAADNRAMECLDLDITYRDEDVLLSLKRGYTAEDDLPGTFPDFVASTVEPVQGKADEICDTTLENASPELLDLVQRLTDAGARLAECIEDEIDVTNEDALDIIKNGYFGNSVHIYPSMTEFATSMVADTEDAVEAECS